MNSSDKLIEMIEAIRTAKGQWEHLDCSHKEDFDCVVYVHNRHWQSIMREISSMGGEIISQEHQLYKDQTVFGYKVFVVQHSYQSDKYHPPFRVCTTSLFTVD